MRMYHCRHCGAEFDARHIDRHEKVCLKNHAMLTELLRVLDDGTGRAIRRKEYRDRTTQQPVCDSHLVNTFGSWDDAMRALGLRPPIRGAGGLNAPLTDEERFCCQRRAQAEQSYYRSK